MISVTVSMVSVVATGCAGDDGSTETNASTAAGSSGAAASSDDGGETTADTGPSPTTAETGESLTSTDTGASPTSTGTAGADETAAGDTTTGNAEEVAAYCDCVFVTCHEAYHARWGEDEFASRAACEAEAGALTPAGVSCRLAACEAVASEAECTDAIAPPRCE